VGEVKLSPRGRVEAVMPLVDAAARRHEVPRALILGVIQVESSFKPRARSRAGARGLMQLMPRTAASLARRLGVDDDYAIDDPAFNVEAGTLYLAWLTRYFDGDLRLALAGYNAGPTRVKRWHREGRPLPRKVARYAANVLAARERFMARMVGTSKEEHEGEDKEEEDKEENEPQLDTAGLRDLIRRKERLYGQRPDEPLPEDGAAGI
jgi:soluble lytic murein transglycosylase-like protein